METDVETRHAQRQPSVRPVTFVVIEPTDPEPGETASSPALMRSGLGGRLVLTPVPGRGAIDTCAGRILLLLRGDDEDQVDEAPAVRVVGCGVDAEGGVEVVHVGMRSRRPLRADDRFAVARTAVELIGPSGVQPARLHDVSMEGLRLSTAAHPEVGDDVTVRGELVDDLGDPCELLLHGRVVRLNIVSPSLTLVGVHLADSQRVPAARLVRWARRRGGTRTAVPTP